ncbi:hypothetical protein [Pseudoroseicyclus sp. CXY001]|uniref:hypothetical protein n=1 Tax=Pseudoroseicyclus sp. CXY001 TaxID=3242492 RepID=UPI00358DA377
MKSFDDHDGHSYAPGAEARLHIEENTLSVQGDGVAGGPAAEATAAAEPSAAVAQELDGITATLQEGMGQGDPINVIGNVGEMLWPPGPAFLCLIVALVVWMALKARQRTRAERRAEECAARQAEAERQAHLDRQKDFAEMRRQRAQRQAEEGGPAAT